KIARMRVVLSAWLLLVGWLVIPLPSFAASAPGELDRELMAQAFAKAARLPRLSALVVARHGVIQAERPLHGSGLDVPVNITSVSKSIVSALVGIAIAEGKLSGVEQPIAPFFARYRERVDPRFERVTVGDLLTMRSGLARTSGEGYMPWVS